MLEKLQELNKEIQIYDVSDMEFETFGRVIKDIDVTEIIEVAKTIDMPESGSSYLPSVEKFEKLDIAKTLKNEFYGTLPTQVGYCWGHSNFMDATEWHFSNEINIATTSLVLILGHVWDIKDGMIDSSKFKAFYLPAGTVAEVYSTTLHFCPCEVSAEGFGCVVALPTGTNVPHDIKVDSPVNFKKNKWIMCHIDNQALAERGVLPGITGINYEIKY